MFISFPLSAIGSTQSIDSNGDTSDQSSTLSEELDPANKPQETEEDAEEYVPPKPAIRCCFLYVVIRPTFFLTLSLKSSVLDSSKYSKEVRKKDKADFSLRIKILPSNFLRKKKEKKIFTLVIFV